MNACGNDEFNCRDGYCIDIFKRCDGRTDCPDKSGKAPLIASDGLIILADQYATVTDEMNCTIFSKEVSYLKEVPPPAVSEEATKIAIHASVNVKAILDIAEVEGLIGIQFDLSFKWRDRRLTFYNLKNGRNFNTLKVRERSQLWIPEIIFYNTKDKTETLNDNKAYLTVLREGRHKRTPMATLENAYIYEGKQNPLIISRVYSLEFLCEFNMAVYPFDTQVCSIVMVMKGNTGEFAEVFADTISYSGPIDLSQYFVKDYSLLKETMTSGENSVKVKLVFGRRVLSTFLTTYLPMIVLCLVSFSTNYFKAFFFEAIVTVNLTALLVQTTLFISISESLPKTNYIKMMDVWCIFNLFIPFIEVVIQTYMDNLREEKNRTINHHGRTINVASLGNDQQGKTTKVGATRNNGAVKVANGASYPQELIARNEKQELAARQDYYRDSVRIMHPRKMKAAQVMAKVVFPVAYICFIVCFFATGMAIYSQDNV